MKVRVVNFDIDNIHPELLENFPHDYIYEGAELDAHQPTAEELVSYGFDKEDAELLYALMVSEGTVIIDGVPGFDDDPITMEKQDYEVIDS